MYFFSLNLHFWFDKICIIPDTKLKKLKIWDLIENGGSFFIYIGEKVSFPSLYNKIYKNKTDNFKIYQKQFLTKKTINLIHRLVKTYFTAYKKVFSLFLPTFEIEKLFKYKINKNYKKKQNLTIFPDIWTAFVKLKTFEIYHWQSTVIQKIKLFWEIKQWKRENLICTWSQIFQDRNNLEKITIRYPHRRYYKNQQDPRYNVFDIVKKMKEIYNCQLETFCNFSL